LARTTQRYRAPVIGKTSHMRMRGAPFISRSIEGIESCHPTPNGVATKGVGLPV
jgi:hypothetical protein